MPQEPTPQEPNPQEPQRQFVRIGRPLDGQPVNPTTPPTGYQEDDFKTPWFTLDDFNPKNIIGRTVESTVRDVRGLVSDEDFGPSAYGEPQSVAGKITQGLIDFAPWMAAERVALRVGLDVAKVGVEARKASKLLKVGEVVGGGALGGFMMGKQGAALSNMLAQMPPGVAQEIGSILATNPDDSELERRLKAVLEGSVIGVGAHALLGLFVKGVKAAHYEILGKHELAAKARYEAGVESAKYASEKDAELARGVMATVQGMVKKVPRAPRVPVEEVAKQGGLLDGLSKVYPKTTAEDLIKTVEARETDPALNYLLQQGDAGPGDMRIANAKGGLTPYAMTAEERLITASRKGDTNSMRTRGPRGAVEVANVLNRAADAIHNNSVVEGVAEQNLRDIDLLAEASGFPNPVRSSERLAAYKEMVKNKPKLAKDIAELGTWARAYKQEADYGAEELFSLADRAFKNQADSALEAEFLDRYGYQVQTAAIGRAAVSEFARVTASFGQDGFNAIKTVFRREKFRGAVEEGKIPGLLDAVVKRAEVNDSVPFSTLVVDRAAYDKAVEALPGGRKGVLDMMAKYSKFANSPKPTGMAAKLVAEGAKPKNIRAWDFFFEGYLNFILSGPRTISNVLQQEWLQGMYVQPVRSAIGGRINEIGSAILGNFKRAGEHAQAARVAARRVTADAMFNPMVMQRAPNMLKMAFGPDTNKALKAGPSEIAEMWRNGPKISYEPIAEYIKSKGWNPDAPFARFIYWMATEKGLNLGHVIRTPSRTLSSIDASIRANIHNGGVWSELEEEAVRRFPTNTTAASDYIQREFDKMTKGGRLRTKDDLLEEATKDASDIAAVQSMSKAKQNELRDRIFNQKMDEEKPLLDMAQYYEREGNEGAATLSPDSKFGKQAINLLQHPVAKFFSPFPRASYSIFSTAAKPFNPLSYWEIARNFRVPAESINLNEIHGKLAKDFLSGDARRMADATGRMATAAILGGTIVYFGQSEAPDGLPYITGSGPKSVEARKNMQALGGWLPDSIYVPGYGRIQWRRADPIATMASAYANFANFSRFTSKEDVGVVGNVLSALHLAGTEAMKNASYVQGMTDLGELLQGGLDPMTWLKKQVGNVVVPNFVTQLTPTIEETAGTAAYVKEVDGITDAWMAKLPFSDVAPKRNILGEPLKAQNYLGLDVLSPYAANQTTDPVVQREFNKLGLTMDKPSKNREGIDLEKIPAGNTTAYNRFQELVGEKNAAGMTLRDDLRKMFNSKWYQSMPEHTPPGVENPRSQNVRRAIEDRRSLAFYKLLRENQGVKDALKQATIRQAQAYRK